MTTTNINDTLVSLEGLVTGYDQVLAAAKKQLEDFDFDQEQIDRAVKNAVANDNFQSAVAHRVSRQMLIDLNRDDSDQMDALVKSVADKVWANLKDALRGRMLEYVDELMRGDEIASKIASKVGESKDISKAVTVTEHMDSIMQLIASDWESKEG